MKPEIYCNKKTEKLTVIWKLNKMLLNRQLVKKETETEILRQVEMETHHPTAKESINRMKRQTTLWNGENIRKSCI